MPRVISFLSVGELGWKTGLSGAGGRNPQAIILLPKTSVSTDLGFYLVEWVPDKVGKSTWGTLHCFLSNTLFLIRTSHLAKTHEARTIAKYPVVQSACVLLGQAPACVYRAGFTEQSSALWYLGIKVPPEPCSGHQCCFLTEE